MPAPRRRRPDLNGLDQWTPEKQKALERLDPKPDTTYFAEVVEELRGVEDGQIPQAEDRIRAWRIAPSILEG